jgi:hypothetical protein
MKRLATTERGGRAESEWVARCLEELGHEEVVGDPNFHLMHATRNRNVKPDRRDARTLAEACRNGNLPPAHRSSEVQRHLRAQLAVRDALNRHARAYIVLGRALRRHGFRIREGRAESFAERR